MSFYTDTIVKSPLFHSLVTNRNMAMLEPGMLAAVRSVISDAAMMGISLRVSETYRSQELQIKDYNAGLSHLKLVGVHHYGLACDLFMVRKDRAFWGTVDDWKFIVPLCRKAGLISGVDWGRDFDPNDWHDPDHVQRITVDDQDKLFAGAWYPDANYNPYD